MLGIDRCIHVSTCDIIYNKCYRELQKQSLYQNNNIYFKLIFAI